MERSNRVSAIRLGLFGLFISPLIRSDLSMKSDIDIDFDQEDPMCDCRTDTSRSFSFNNVTWNMLKFKVSRSIFSSLCTDPQFPSLLLHPFLCHIQLCFHNKPHFKYRFCIFMVSNEALWNAVAHWSYFFYIRAAISMPCHFGSFELPFIFIIIFREFWCPDSIENPTAPLQFQGDYPCNYFILKVLFVDFSSNPDKLLHQIQPGFEKTGSHQYFFLNFISPASLNLMLLQRPPKNQSASQFIYR